eukprot:TRINITY_DN73837_c0_g1_i1.p1 TRINITY_DN73837_c0_g1~~TRINITY_DN73837_c0_g1_i1.p1  ORF type:complete len:838 (+),score=149.58 TRINITY_DN73837_c0_g1_i1:69-2582(+)
MLRAGTSGIQRVQADVHDSAKPQKAPLRVLSFRDVAKPKTAPSTVPVEKRVPIPNLQQVREQEPKEEVEFEEEAMVEEEEEQDIVEAGEQDFLGDEEAMQDAMDDWEEKENEELQDARIKEEGGEEESMLETDDWKTEFDRKWAAAMGKQQSAGRADAKRPLGQARPKSPPARPPEKRSRIAPKSPPPAPQKHSPSVPPANSKDSSASAAAAAAAAAASRFAAARRGQGKSTSRLPPASKAGKPASVEPKRPPPAKHGALPMKSAPPTPGVASKNLDLDWFGTLETTSEVQIRGEHPEWAPRCTMETARPGQPQKITINMAETGLDDAQMAVWCSWMDRRFNAERPTKPGQSQRSRFKASTVDFSENKLSANGMKALCNLLEKQGVRCEVLRMTGNLIGNEGTRCISKYLASSSQAPAHELLLSRNKVTVEGLKFLMASLALHPAYPIWNSETERFVPLWLRLDNNKIKEEAAYPGLESACNALTCSVCLGEKSDDVACGPRQCVNVGCCDEIKHNCIVHLCGWTVPGKAAPLPSPTAHPRPIFAAPGRSAPKAPPSEIECRREEPRLLYEDEHMAVVMKPAGWSCQPQPEGVDPAWARLKPLARRQQVGSLLSQEEPAPLQAWLLLQFGADPSCEASRDQNSDRGIVHRLDADTSGPMLVSKTLKGYEHARKQILLGLLKDYVALVHGTFSTERGECHAPIDTSTFLETGCVRVDPCGNLATTVWEAIAEYESVDRQESYTLVHCRMVTLRTHQLRVHMQHLGHPLVGDELYGQGSVPEFCPRLFQHKVRIGFFNLQGQTCIETCSLQAAPDLWRALGRLRKVGGMARMGCGAPGR